MKQLFFICALIGAASLYSQTLEIRAKEPESKLQPGREFYYEAYITNTTNAPIVVFRNAALDYGGSRYEWTLTRNGEEVTTKRNFAQDTNSGFRKTNFKTLAPGEETIAWVVRYKPEETGNFTIKGSVIQNPATLNRKWNRYTPEETMNAMSKFSVVADIAFDVNEPERIPFVANDITDQPTLGEKPVIKDLLDAPYDPGKFYRLDYKITDPATAAADLALIATLGNLRWLNLSLDLPERITLPAELSKLKLDRLELVGGKGGVVLPDGFLAGQPVKMITLNGGITNLVPLGGLTELEFLTLRVKEMPADMSWLGQLTELKGLSVSGTNLTALPAEISQLTKLEGISLGQTAVTDISPLFDLTKLTSLSAMNCKLDGLPAGIGQLTELEVLQLSKNNITSLPKEFGQLTKLKKFEMTSTGLATLDPSFYGAVSLESILLNDNKLEELPDGISALTKLKSLNVPNNMLKSLPEDLGDAPSLYQVFAAGNRLKTLPASLTKIKSQWATVSIKGSKPGGKGYKAVKKALGRRLKE